VADRQTSIILRGMGYSGGFGIFHCTKNALLLNYYRDVHIYIYWFYLLNFSSQNKEISGLEALRANLAEHVS